MDAFMYNKLLTIHRHFLAQGNDTIPKYEPQDNARILAKFYKKWHDDSKDPYLYDFVASKEPLSKGQSIKLK
jgi:hypothetical protein